VDDTGAERGRPARVVGIGASAGGVDALIRLVRHLPADLPAAICIVLHVPATGRSLLAPILDRVTELAVAVAVDGEPLVCGRIYVAPPDRHLTVAEGQVRLDRGPKENAVRPAVDPMLRSLAAAYGERSVAVVLSGALGDGSSGAVAVKQAGGTVIVQDPDDATVPSMPTSALRAVGDVDAVLRSHEIGTALLELADPARRIREDTAVPVGGEPLEETVVRPPGPPSAFTCPECHGPLWEVDDGPLVSYRCRVGHGFSEDALIIEQGSAVEAALWSALEALEERAEFLRRVAARHGTLRPRLRDRFDAAARDAVERAELIRHALGTGDEAVTLDLQTAEASE
jgi:two-component system, chemotaxis family, protein-glutamate methylesterase/glutaminase